MLFHWLFLYTLYYTHTHTCLFYHPYVDFPLFSCTNPMDNFKPLVFKLYPFFHDEIWTEYPLNDILQFATENDRLKMSPLGLFVNMETLCGRVRVHITFSVHTLCGRPLSSGPQCVCYTCSHVHVVYYGNCMLCFICSQTKTHMYRTLWIITILHV